MSSSERYAVLRSKFPPVLLGHRPYVASLETIAASLEKLAKCEGAVTCVSPARMANMLRAALFHAHDDCAECAAERKQSLLPVEQRLLRAYHGERKVAGYKNSAHDKCASSLAKVSVELTAPGGTLFLLPALLERLAEKSAFKPSRAAAAETAPQLTA